MRRVLQINDFLSAGGAEVVMARTAALLRTEGWEVDIFTAADLDDRRLTPRRYVDNPVARRSLATRLASFQPDIVHLHNYYHQLSPGILAELAAYKRGRAAQVVMTAHDCHLICPDSGGTWYPAGSGSRRPIDGQRLGRWSYLLSRSWDRRGLGHSCLKLAQHLWNYRVRDRRQVLDLVICPSRFLEGLCARAGLPTTFLANPAPAWPRLQRDRSGSLRLAFAGRLEPEKGVREFLEILPPGFAGTFTIVGDGQEAQPCRATCRRRGLERVVWFLGRLSRGRVQEILAQAHILVLPSLFLENNPMSLLEALAVGTNLLVSDRGGTRELIEATGVGYVFSPGDARSLAARLEEIARAHKEGSLNRFDASRFLEQRSEQAYLRGLLEVYEGRAAA
jgi:glycosyltransferase involved in cell wall biosynthesis